MDNASKAGGAPGVMGGFDGRTWLLDRSNSTNPSSLTFDAFAQTGSASEKIGNNAFGNLVTVSTAKRFDATLGSGNDRVTMIDGQGHVAAGAGDDVVSLSFNHPEAFRVPGNTYVEGGAGKDTFNIDYRQYGLDSDGLPKGTLTEFYDDANGGLKGNSNLNAFSSIETLNLKLTDAVDTVSFAGLSLLQGSRVSIDAGAGQANPDPWRNPSGGDDLTLDFSAAGETQAVKMGMDADGTIRIGASVFKGFEGLTVVSGAGDDVLRAVDNGVSLLRGEDGNDRLYASKSGVNDLQGGSGNDTYYINGSRDGVSIFEGANNGYDVVISNGTAYLPANVEKLYLTGNSGAAGYGNELANTLIGDASDNRLEGGDGSDWLLGNGGNDTLVGGNGIDILIGGTGKDMFVFDTLETSAERDVIRGFELGKDKLALSKAVFAAMSNADGSLSDSSFITGTKAVTADQHLIYNQTKGELFYDADGSGKQAAVMIATFDTKPTITAHDFVVI